MVTIEIETIGMERMVRSFNRIGMEVQDSTVPFTFIVQDFQQLEKQIFAKEGSPAKFAPLSARYAIWKAKRYPGRKVMELTGRLKASLTKEGGPDAVRVINKNYAARKTRVPYAHRHQLGTLGMPRREFVQVTEAVKRRWTRIIQRWAMGLFEKFGIRTYGDYTTSGRWLGL